MRPIRGDPSTTGPTQSPTTHRARTRPNEDLTREREVVTRYHRKNACIKFGVDTSTTGTIQGRTTHRARTRPNKKQTREREVVIANHVRMSREQPVQSSVSIRALRARPKAQWHVDPKREAMARYHHKNACEQRCQLSLRSGVVRWCYEESRENGRTGPAGPWARIQIILSQDHRQVVLMAHMKFRAVPTSFDTVMVNHTAPRARPEPSQRFDPIKSARDPKRPYLGPTTAT